MPLKVDQFGIEFSLGPPAKTGLVAPAADLCCEDAEEQKRREEDRLVERVAERVLAAMRSERER